jgi:hypothetical protein
VPSDVLQQLQHISLISFSEQFDLEIATSAIVGLATQTLLLARRTAPKNG